MIDTLLLSGDDPADVETAVSLLRRGGVVAVPTETVYGLAADAGNRDAVQRVFAAKGRPATHPLIVHVVNLNMAKRVAAGWPIVAQILGEAFWPGPLTLLVERNDGIDDSVTGGRRTVAVRVPAHPVLRRVLEGLSTDAFIGLAAPSANKFGAVSPTCAEHVLRDMTGIIDAVLDGGPSQVGVESTIVDCTGEIPRILRPGGVSAEDIRDRLSHSGIELAETEVHLASDDPVVAVAPGMLVSHYAPDTRLEVFESQSEIDTRRAELEDQGKRVILLPHPPDPTVYSQQLYANLRDCDQSGADVILALLPHRAGVGLAVRDRLVRASTNR